MLALLAPSAKAAPFTWNTGVGFWGTAGNWTPAGGPPNSAVDIANFNLVVGTGFGIFLTGGPFTVNQLNFQNDVNGFFVFQLGTLIFAGAAPQINMAGPNGLTLASTATFQLNVTTTIQTTNADSGLTLGGLSAVWAA